jgi:integrase
VGKWETQSVFQVKRETQQFEFSALRLFHSFSLPSNFAVLRTKRHHPKEYRSSVPHHGFPPGMATSTSPSAGLLSPCSLLTVRSVTFSRSREGCTLIRNVNNVTNYHIKTVLFKSGERFPILVDGGGVPLHQPTVFAIAEVRNPHRAFNTIVNALGALSIFHRFLDDRRIELSSRLEDGQLLELGEIETLVRFCRNDFSRRKPGKPVVTSEVCGTRLRTIRKYLEWLAKGKLLATDYAHSSLLQQRLRLTLDTIKVRIPPSSGERTDPREGLAPEVVQHAKAIFDPRSTTNPWSSEHVRFRNYLIWNVFHHLGVRGGELLGIRVRHVDLRRGTLSIVRQADAHDDPRRRQPSTKTLARELDISDVLQRLITDYILVHRRKLRNAQRHDFLFVSDTGNPLSLSGLNRIFRDLRAKCPEVPRELTPHVLRHTWNDNFSEEVDGKNIDPEVEKKARSLLMGWKPTSNSAAIYTRRFVRKKAKEVSMSLQSKAISGSKE